jgi:hypothetical protein
MPTTRPFSYNTGSPISGTIQVGNLAVGYPTTGYTGMEWWNGPDEELGYVIAQPVPDDSQPTPIPGVTGSVGFFRTNGYNDSEFVSLANLISNANYNNPTAAATGLTLNGYWNSYVYPVLSLDAANYPGSGTTWTDSVGGKQFTLFNSPTYSSNNGGYITFTPSSSQYAKSSSSLSSLTTWTVEIWHYYTGTNNGLSPCIVTEFWPNGTGNINFSVGNNSDTSPLLQAGFFNGGWRNTPTYTLTANNWYQIVGSYDGSTVKLYVNNTLVQSTNYTGTPATGGAGIVLMRRWDDPPGGYWGGRLAIVNIYDKALSSDQLTGKWNSTKSRFGL